MERSRILAAIGAEQEFDIAVVGGGATGLGCAVDAAARGYRTVLLEAHDFAKGTSSRSTKLVHGGVRYLQQGDLKLVLEALRERGRMLRNAPHLAHRRAFVIPAYAYWELPFYGVGLTLYDVLARSERIGRSQLLSANGARARLPGVRADGLKGGVLYYDGQFDDARYAIALLRTLFDQGGFALNYAPVESLLQRSGEVCGVSVHDRESGERFEIRAKSVINATGIFSDSVRSMDDAASSQIIQVSQGTHLVLPRSFLPGDSALMIPRTADGRVLFAIPWHDRIVVGTTDDAVPQAEIEPRALHRERAFLLEHVRRYLNPALEESEIRSVWSGQRPLVRQGGGENTAALSRDHTILISPSKLVTVTGGKWTTYRKMAEDAIDRASAIAQLRATPSPTATLRLHGSQQDADPDSWTAVYGTDLSLLRKLPGAREKLHPALPFSKAEVTWAARYEMARTVEDVLARRTRALFLDAEAAIEAAPETARLLAEELQRGAEWQSAQVEAFMQTAQGYLWR